jgi:hypothetical protein
MNERQNEIAPTNRDLEAMEAAGGVRLDEAARRTTVAALRNYAQDCGLEAFSKRRTKLEADINNLRQRARKIHRRHGLAWQEAASGQSDLSATVRALEQLLEPATSRQREVPPEYVRVWKLLIRLEKIFQRAGGRSTGVHRGTSEVRGGAFLDFANAAVRCVPPSIRPTGIGSTWEEIYSQRKKGRASLLTMSLPKGFGITFTSRRVRRR